MGNGVVEQKPAIPAYVPPKPRPSLSAEVSEPRGSHLKAKRRIIVGNVSKWISTDDREDMSTHKWMLYVRGDKESPDVSDVVERVRFLIHQSYHPNNLIEVTKAPFQLTRRGWGEFTARVQLFFKNPRLNKPVSILHDLKLDKTYTGLQTFGAETCVEVWLQPDQEKDNRSSRR
jgi:transcription initiation factor IIF auxiliary subunit